jgi:tRNA (guanine-N7-)-methyltransferase
VIELIPQATEETLDFCKLFGRAAPVHIDLGCGDGSFLQSLATEHPEWNFLGIERLLRRVRKSDRKAGALPNLQIIRSETMFLLKHLLSPASVDCFYLLFPDPWPKRRHHRRRLVSREFLDAIWSSLTERGLFYLATDHDDYFAAIRELLDRTPQFAPINSTWRLPATPFENKFIGKGTSIHRLALRKVSPVT